MNLHGYTAHRCEGRFETCNIDFVFDICALNSTSGNPQRVSLDDDDDDQQKLQRSDQHRPCTETTDPVGLMV